jgi:hypothetical protein
MNENEEMTWAGLAIALTIVIATATAVSLGMLWASGIIK